MLGALSVVINGSSILVWALFQVPIWGPVMGGFAELGLGGSGGVGGLVTMNRTLVRFASFRISARKPWLKAIWMVRAVGLEPTLGEPTRS